ncbi:MAG: ATP-binding protein, partial [Planctomycetota bacterium]
FSTIQTRIVLPFLILFSVVFCLVTYITVHILSLSVKSQIREQIVTLSSLLSHSGFPLNDVALKQISQLLGAETATLNADNKIIDSTLKSEQLSELNNFFHDFLSRHTNISKPSDKIEIKEITILGCAYIVSYSPVKRGAVRGLVLLFNSAKVKEIWWNAAEPIIILAAAAVALVVVISYLIAMSITRPLRKLVYKTSEVAAGKLDETVSVNTQGEIQQLADAFNKMIIGLREYQQKLIQKEKLATVGMLAATVAHEIKNPLSSIRMNCQILRLQSSDKELCEVIDIVLSEVERLDFSINSLLFFASSPKKELSNLNVVDILKQIAQLLHRQFEHRGIIVTEDYQQNMPLTLLDSKRIKTVIINLLLNASEAMPEGGVITLSASLSGAALTISVADTGGGLSPEAKANLFEPFVTTKHGGCGLGLAIVKKIIEEENGTISYQSVSGKTIFTVSLPLHNSN